MIRINNDALGITAAIACAIHCSLLPIILGSLPILGLDIINNDFFEGVMIALAAFISFRSLRHGFRSHHHAHLPYVLFGIGIILLIFKQIWHSQQLYFLVPAILAIVTAHVINIRYCQQAGKRHDASCNH